MKTGTHTQVLSLCLMHVVRWYLSDDAKLQRKGLPRKKSSPDNERETMSRLQVADCQLDAEPSASHDSTCCSSALFLE